MTMTPNEIQYRNHLINQIKKVQDGAARAVEPYVQKLADLDARHPRPFETTVKQVQIIDYAKGIKSMGPK